jgi:putative Mn2+ efflux pump MntP
MSLLEIILISFGLAMDCFAVSIAVGCKSCKIKASKIIQIAFFFGLFQALMPVVGWFLGNAFKNYISSVDHWIAFGILGFIGGKMLFEAFFGEEQKSFDINKLFVVLTLSVATSIDAFIVGMSFAVLKVNIVIAVTLIGVITFLVTIFGAYFGKRLNLHLGKWAEIFGGIVLIGIGAKVLIEHLSV